MTNFIPQMIPWFGEEETKAVQTYMQSGGFFMEFKKTQEFEKRIAEVTGSKHAIVVNNGTISLIIANFVLGIGKGDEVIIPNYTMIATANSVQLVGAKPIFVDIDETTLCMNLDQTKKAITDRTKAILFVNANGRYPKEGIDSFVDLAKEKNVILIEDSAQALGSFYPDGRHMGTVGEIGSFSFSVPKIISTGQGGALITNSDQIATEIRKMKDFGRVGGGFDIHSSVGLNAKFTDIQAVIGIEQMKKLPYRLSRKKEILKIYQNELVNISEIKFFEQDLNCTTPWFIDVLIEKKRDELIPYLKKNGIGSRTMYPPINKQECYQIEGEHPVSNKIGEKGLWLPSFTQITNEEIDKVCDTIKKFFRS